jgi:subfamily B ATP-binding cassette protein MsbA
MKGLIRLLWGYKPYLWLLAASLFASLLAQAIVFFIFPLLNIVIYDSLVLTLNKKLLLEIILTMVFLIFSVTAFSLVVDISAVLLKTKVAMLLRSDQLAALLDYRYDFYIQNQTGQLIQKLIPDIDLISDAAAKLFQALACLAQLLIFFIIVGVIDLQMFLIYAGILSLYWVWLAVWRPFVKSSSLRIGEEYGHLYSYFYEIFPGIKEIKYLGLHDYVKQRMFGRLTDLRRHQVRNALYNSFLYMSNSAIPWIGFCVILTVGVFKLEGGKFTIGMLIAVFGFMWRFFAPVDKITEGYFSVQEGCNAAARLDQLRGDHFEKEGTKKFVRLESSIKFSRLSFQYEEGRKILRDIDLEIAKGSNVAFVGHSGSGKTTLVHLLLRIFDGYQGSIKIDGLELTQYDLKSLRDRIAIVSQDIYLFNDTIRRNIDFTGKMDERELGICAERSHLDILIDRLPEGFETVIGERGVKLSGGEKQRLALARTFARDSDIIIFDEATSALDPNLERQIKESMKLLNANRTSITITHRPNTVVDLDRIYVFSNGGIVEQGSHAELISKKGHYHELFYKE